MYRGNRRLLPLSHAESSAGSRSSHLRFPVMALPRSSLLLLCGPLLASAFMGGRAPVRRNSVAPRVKTVRQVASLPVSGEVAVPKHLANKANLPPLAPEDAWIGELQLDEFGKEIRALGKKLDKEQDLADVKHIKKIRAMAFTCMGIGFATMWMKPNIFTAFFLSLWTFSSWTTIAHHTCHGGYNKADPTRFFNSKGFALGTLKKRVTQWFDWMLPEAWNVEHNNLHHYRLGEIDDPDYVERNLEFVRTLPVPRFFKYGAVAFLMCTWKWFYYAPNTYKELVIAEKRRRGEIITEDMGPQEAFTLKYFLEPKSMRKTHKWYNFRDFFKRVMGPYLIGHFFILPLPVLAIGWGLGGQAQGLQWFGNAVKNLLLADVITNIHSFIAIATNHAGEDLYMFDRSCAPNSPTFFLRQVISSANFRTGGDTNDFMHGWLNYQVEHHLWPSLSALSYQKAQPQVAEICSKYGVPYVQENVFIRLKKTVDIMVGKTSQRRYPGEYESDADAMTWADQKQVAALGMGAGGSTIEAERTSEDAAVVA